MEPPGYTRVFVDCIQNLDLGILIAICDFLESAGHDYPQYGDGAVDTGMMLVNVQLRKAKRQGDYIDYRSPAPGRLQPVS